MAQERIIRKYSNRRLYDAVASHHVTLEDIRKLIVAGEKIKVVDDKSGEDLTRQVLLQVIAEQEQFGAPVLNVPLLELVIRFYGSPLQSMLTGYLEQGIRALTQRQQAMQAEMAKMLETPLAPLTELARANMEMWAQMQSRMLNPFNAPDKPKPDESEKKKK